MRKKKKKKKKQQANAGRCASASTCFMRAWICAYYVHTACEVPGLFLMHLASAGSCVPETSSEGLLTHEHSKLLRFSFGVFKISARDVSSGNGV